MNQILGFLGIFLTILGAALWHERRITKIEVLLTNHLAHSDAFEKLLMRVFEVNLKQMP